MRPVTPHGELESTVTLTDEQWSYVRDALEMGLESDEPLTYELRYGGTHLRDALDEIKRQT